MKEELSTAEKMLIQVIIDLYIMEHELPNNEIQLLSELREKLDK